VYDTRVDAEERVEQDNSEEDVTSQRRHSHD
jgi:hypothetical protein